MPRKFPLLSAVAFSLCAALAFAQEVPSAEKAAPPEKAPAKVPPRRIVSAAAKKPTPKPQEAPIAEVMATPDPTPKKPSFFRRLFGGGKRQPAATPTPAPTPKPRKPTRKPTSTPAPDTANAKVKPTEKPSPSVIVEKPATSSKTAAAAAKKTEPEVPADADAEAKEKQRFEAAKTKAAADPQVKSLKAKADNAATDDESRKALRAYNKALFEKIRKTDSGVAERATRLEAAILKRLTE